MVSEEERAKAEMMMEGPKPDFMAQMSLQNGEDPAASAEAEKVDVDETLSELGKVQKAILPALRAITLSDETIRDEQKGWVQYKKVPNITAEFGWHNVANLNAHRASVSRSVRSLMERKLVAGAVSEYRRFYGMDQTAGEPHSLLTHGAEPWRQNEVDERTGERVTTPRLHYVRLTAWGHAVAAELMKEHVDDETTE